MGKVSCIFLRYCFHTKTQGDNSWRASEVRQKSTELWHLRLSWQAALSHNYQLKRCVIIFPDCSCVVKWKWSPPLPDHFTDTWSVEWKQQTRRRITWLRYFRYPKLKCHAAAIIRAWRSHEAATRTPGPPVSGVEGKSTSQHPNIQQFQRLTENWRGAGAGSAGGSTENTATVSLHNAECIHVYMRPVLTLSYMCTNNKLPPPSAIPCLTSTNICPIEVFTARLLI